MFKKVLGRSLGGTAIAGLVLTAAPVAVSPSFVMVACEGYPPPATTSLTLTLDRSFASYGTKTNATIKVTTGANTPVDGTVRLVVNGRHRGLSTLGPDGVVTRLVPRRLVAGKTHKIRADFIATCLFAGDSDTKNYSVFRAKTATRAKVVKAGAAKFRARVIGSTGLVVRKGKVSFVVRNTTTKVKVRSSIRRVRKGVARADLLNLPPGSYKLVTRYLGTKNWKASKGVKRFRVR